MARVSKWAEMAGWWPQTAIVIVRGRKYPSDKGGAIVVVVFLFVVHP